MDLNNIRLLRKEELIQKLRQSGFGEVATILEDKDINGEWLLELKEFEIFKWKLSPIQKRSLWNCIKQIKDNPSILMVQPKSKVIQRPVQSIPKVIKKPVRPNSKLIQKPTEPTPKVSQKPIQPKPKLVQKPVEPMPKITQKPFEPTPKFTQKPTEPTPRVIQKPAQPSPKVIQKQVNPKPRNGDEVDENTVFKNKLKELLGGAATSVSSNTLPKVSKTRPPIQNEPNPANKPLPPTPPPSPPLRNAAVRNTSIKRINKLPLPAETEPPNDEAYLVMSSPGELAKPDYGYLSPLDVPMAVKNKNISPRSPMKRETNVLRSVKPVDELERNYENFENAYELSPPSDFMERRRDVPDRKSPLMTDDDEAVDYEHFPEEVPSAAPRTALKDLREGIVKITPPQESKFSFLTSKLNTFFKQNTKAKIEYENHDIQGEKNRHVDIPVRNRPLPQIPDSPPHSRSRSFSRALPVPREELPDSNSEDTYVQLTEDLPSVKPPFVAEESAHSEDEDGIYQNTAKTQNVDEEEQLIYENASRVEVNFEDEQIYENSEDAHGQNPSTALKKNPLVGISSKQFTHRDLNEKAPPETSIETNEDVNRAQPKSVHGLALLLSQKLMERDQRLQRQQATKQQTPESGTDSEFDDDDLPEYGNVSLFHQVDDSLPSPIAEEPIVDIPPPVEARRIPINERPLPEIPKFSNGASEGVPSPIANRKQDSFNRNLTNNSMKEERSVNSNSTPGPGPSNYEHHVMKFNKESDTRQRPGIPIPVEEENHNDRIFHLSEEPFYRNTDRRGAKQILSRFGNGAFLFRPSETFFLVLTVKHNNKIYNFGIERNPNHKLVLNTAGNMESPEFSTLKEFVSYFTEEPVTFEDTNNELVEIYLKTYLQNS